MGIRDMDEDQLRSGSAVLLGACFIMLPFLGAWGCTLGFMRFATGWRDTGRTG